MRWLKMTPEQAIVSYSCMINIIRKIPLKLCEINETHPYAA